MRRSIKARDFAAAAVAAAAFCGYVWIMHTALEIGDIAPGSASVGAVAHAPSGHPLHTDSRSPPAS